ncbi:hemolysin family protein [Priestia aryabhattai]|uniref:hemolysin family protein n=1 Tax=Priestia aryabhattai TaxID=412384 RepID=UPI003D284F2E
MGDLPLNQMMILVVLLMLSAFFSSAETAFSSVNKIRLKHYAEKKYRGSKKALHIAEHFEQTLSTILVGNVVVNIAASSLAAKIALDMFKGNLALVLSIIVMTIIILIFGEVLPKSLAKEHAESFALMISSLLFLIIKLLTPISFLFLQVKKGASHLLASAPTPTITEDEIKVMVDLSEEEGTINNIEKELVHRSLNFNDIVVGQILKPRIDVTAVDVNADIDSVCQMFLEERYSRVPVYEDHIDNIIGILSEREFLTCLVQRKEISIRDLLRQPIFVVESMKISVLLPELQKSKVHMAIVVDEFGGTAGLVTLEDILEEIVGEIWDEHDEAVKYVHQIGEKEYEFNADIPIDEFLTYVAVSSPNSTCHTLGGWIYEQFDHIPAKGDFFSYEEILFTIKEVENRRIRKVSVKSFANKNEEAD